MQIQINGELRISELRQALYELLLQLEDDFAIHFSKGATLYVNPTDEFGEAVVARKHGTPINKMVSKGPYRSAADELKL